MNTYDPILGGYKSPEEKIKDLIKELEEKEIRKLTLENLKLKKEQRKRAEKSLFSWEDIEVYSDGSTNLDQPRSFNTTRLPYKILKAFGDSPKKPPEIKFAQFKEEFKKEANKKVKQAVNDLRRYKDFQDIFQSLPNAGYRLKRSSK